jgi:hypothetical protein
MSLPRFVYTLILVALAVAVASPAIQVLGDRDATMEVSYALRAPVIVRNAAATAMNDAPETHESRAALEQWRELLERYLVTPSSEAKPIRAELDARAAAAATALAAAQSGVAIQRPTGGFDRSLDATLDALDRIGPKAHAQSLEMVYGASSGSVIPEKPVADARRAAGQQLLGMLDRAIERLRVKERNIGAHDS